MKSLRRMHQIFLARFFLLSSDSEKTLNTMLEKTIKRLSGSISDIAVSKLDKQIEGKIYNLLIANPETVLFLADAFHRKKQAKQSFEKAEKENPFLT